MQVILGSQPGLDVRADDGVSGSIPDDATQDFPIRHGFLRRAVLRSHRSECARLDSRTCRGSGWPEPSDAEPERSDPETPHARGRYQASRRGGILKTFQGRKPCEHDLCCTSCRKERKQTHIRVVEALSALPENVDASKNAVAVSYTGRSESRLTPLPARQRARDDDETTKGQIADFHRDGS